MKHELLIINKKLCQKKLDNLDKEIVEDGLQLQEINLVEEEVTILLEEMELQEVQNLQVQVKSKTSSRGFHLYD